MKTTSRLLIALIVLLLASLACSVDIQLTDEPPTEAPPAVQPATMTPVKQSPTEIPPTDAPTVPASVTAQPPTVEPAPAASPYTPSGFLMAAPAGNSVTVYTRDGQPTGSFQAPGLNLGPSSNLHVAGSAPGGVIQSPVIFSAFDDTAKIKQNLNGQISDLIVNQDLGYLAGADGQNAWVHTTVSWNGDALVSKLYAHGPGGGGDSPLLERVDPTSYAVQPLALQASAGEPMGIWYALMPWGIGGDIVFPPRQGLYYLDITAGGTENLFLTEDFSPQGLSPDMTWIAYIPVDFGAGQGSNTRLTLYNLYSTVMVEIPLRQGSDRGAGYVAFSPDNQRVAWMEGSGWLMAETPNFRSKVIVADINGNIIAELNDQQIASVTGSPNATWVQPAGWLDGETLLVEVIGEDWNNRSLVKMRFDGSQMSVLATGAFAGFVYP
jgi:hypothetical protein